MTDRQKADFAALCLEDRILHGSDGDSIGTYNEKRFHRVYKRLVTEDASCYEVRIGRYVADVLHDGHITEIQTGSFHPLTEKLRYYLSETDFTVTVVKPLIAEKKVIRADRDTGEVIYARRSPKRETVADALSELYYLRDLLANERLEIQLVFIRAEEYRYSERMRYRKKGAYDNDLCPIEITDDLTLCGISSYRALLPQPLISTPFTASDLSTLTSLRQKPLYSLLNTLLSLGILQRERVGRGYVYRVKEGG